MAEPIQSPSDSPWAEGAELPHAPTLEADFEADVAILGGGITGLTLAVLLAESGRRTVVLERARLGSGTTGRTTAHLTAALDVDFRTLVARFGEERAHAVVASVLRSIDEIERRCAGGCGFRRLPGFRFAESARDAESLEEEAAFARRLGLDAEVVKDAPLPFASAGALRLGAQAAFHPLAYLGVLADAAQRAGARIFEESPVVEVRDDGVSLAHGPRVTAAHVVDATHTPVGLVPSIQTRVTAFTSYVVAARLEQPLAAALFWDCDQPYHYVRPFDAEGKRILVGGEDHRTGSEADPHARFAALEAWTRRRFPVADVEERWSHELFEPADGLPYIGALPGSRTRLVAAGYSGTGMTFGTVAALALHERITAGESALERLYTPSRLAPLASAAPVVEETVRIGWRFVADRLRRGGELDELGHDEGRVLRVDGEQLAVYRDVRGDLHYLSPRCTHMGCIVAWNDAEKTWDCPCHGGRFHRTGKVFYGPPTADLEHEEAASRQMERAGSSPASASTRSSAGSASATRRMRRTPSTQK
jgi:glycine/D-amino acid oxidase-like deaminating enzyme/nitrite reductase/ring-hydroxylating ferredoxin subunit